MFTEKLIEDYLSITYPERKDIAVTMIDRIGWESQNSVIVSYHYEPFERKEQEEIYLIDLMGYMYNKFSKH
jgi:hypothetical protein